MPETVPDDVIEVFRAHPELLARCGTLRRAVADQGLSNRVFRLEAERGTFYLRLPLRKQAVRVDRIAEAHNLKLAAEIGVALPPVYCHVEGEVLVTQAVTVLDPAPTDLAHRLGVTLGQLHGSGAAFQSRLDPDQVVAAQRQRLSGAGGLLEVADTLLRTLGGHEGLHGAGRGDLLVPSHGDPSPGNFLAAVDRSWLIDWEFSAMAVPAWDLAYAILEHGFSTDEEVQFLAGYRAAGANVFLPAPAELSLMKTKCDVVSALWALEQHQAGRNKTAFDAFARDRLARARSRLKSDVRS